MLMHTLIYNYNILQISFTILKLNQTTNFRNCVGRNVHGYRNRPTNAIYTSEGSWANRQAGGLLLGGRAGALFGRVPM